MVFNFESGKPVNVDNAQQFVTLHPRCGTSFMFVIMLISMLCLHVDSGADVRGEAGDSHRAAAGDYRPEL